MVQSTIFQVYSRIGALQTIFQLQLVTQTLRLVTQTIHFITTNRHVNNTYIFPLKAYYYQAYQCRLHYDDLL